MFSPVPDGDYPRWSAPLLGAVVGLLCGARAIGREALPWPVAIVGGGCIGALAGVAIFLLDPKSKEVEARGSGSLAAQQPQSSGIIGRFLAAMGVLLCWTPFLGFLLNLVGVIVNYRSQDWALKASCWGLVIGTIVAIATGAGIIFD